LKLAVPDLPLCLGVLKHRAPLARGAHLSANFFYDGFAYVVKFKIFKFPEHVCLTVCVDLPSLLPSGPRVRGLIT